MSKLLYFVFLGLTMVAVTKTFGKYQNLAYLEAQDSQTAVSPALEDQIDFFTKKYDYLKHKSIELDKSVETNEKLYYLTHSDNFEEALFLIDYLGDRFSELEISSSEQIEVAVADIGFYLQRLDENLSVVESDLKQLSSPYQVSQR